MVPSWVPVFGGAFFALMATWALNHEGAVGSSGMWTSWVTRGTGRAVSWFVLAGGLALMAYGAFS